MMLHQFDKWEQVFTERHLFATSLNVENSSMLSELLSHLNKLLHLWVAHYHLLNKLRIGHHTLDKKMEQKNT